MPFITLLCGPNRCLDGAQIAGLAEALAVVAEDVLTAKCAKMQILPFELVHPPRLAVRAGLCLKFAGSEL
jgi:hypothetical protein